MQGRLCKHQIAVWKHFPSALPNLPPVTTEARWEIAKVALGDAAPSKEFFEAPSNGAFGSAEAVVQEPDLGIAADVASEAGPMAQVPAVRQDDAEVQKLFEEVKLGLLSDLERQLNERFDGTRNFVEGMQKFRKRVQQPKNSNQMATFFHIDGTSNNVAVHAGGMIGVQSTAIVRRKGNKPKGRKPLACGRPPTKATRLGLKTTTKQFKVGIKQRAPARSRCLGKNIAANKPNAKSH